jgi:predicted metal-dependent phosphoesterase TrpH
MRDRADLHVHSSVSDGRFSPSELVRKAVELELGGIALTDHDTIGGIDEFLRVDCPDWLTRVPGVEISTEHEGHQAHILGYFVASDSVVLKKKLEWLSDSRRRRFPKMLSRLQEMGIDFSEEEVDSVISGVGSPGRPHIAMLLLNRGLVSSTDEAFMKYVGRGKPAYVKKDTLASLDVIEMLSEIGAAPVLAHPLTMRNADLRTIFKEFMDHGMVGVETTYDYSHMQYLGDPKSVNRALEGLGLIETGGSDFHGDPFHVGLGDLSVSVEVIESLRDAAERT